MSEPFIAEVRMWGCNFAPRGWAFCNGALLPIAENTALFALIGTIYGGDGRTTMGLPNLLDRAPMHHGQGPGLTPRPIGQLGGTPSISLQDDELPAHDHIVKGADVTGTGASPTSDLFMGVDREGKDERIAYISDEQVTNTQLASSALAPSGQSAAHENHQPYLGVNFCIALVGVFPSRS